jgi:hypothetical protein
MSIYSFGGVLPPGQATKIADVMQAPNSTPGVRVIVWSSCAGRVFVSAPGFGPALELLPGDSCAIDVGPVNKDHHNDPYAAVSWAIRGNRGKR